MTILNYSPNFTFYIDSTDYSRELLSLEISLPVSEKSDFQMWDGNFSIALTHTSVHEPDDLSPFANPTHWRPFVSVVTLTIKGVTFPKLRIAEYKWNPRTNQGEGRLTQILEAMTFDRPSEKLDEVQVSTLGTSLNEAVNALLLQAGRVNGEQIIEQSQISISGLTGTIDTDIYASNAANDAQELCSTNWRWLYVDSSEVIRTIANRS